MSAALTPSANDRAGAQINGRPPRTKRKRRAVKLACVGAVLLALYTAFVYVVIRTFDGDRGGSELFPDFLRYGNATSSSDRWLHQKTAALEKDEGVQSKKEPTIADFCGMCQWNRMPFNCNERVQWVVEQKGMSMEEAKLSNLDHCINANGCADKLDDEGFMECGETGRRLVEIGPGGSNEPPPGHGVGTEKKVEEEPEPEAIPSGALFAELTSRDTTLLLLLAVECLYLCFVA